MNQRVRTSRRSVATTKRRTAATVAALLVMCGSAQIANAHAAKPEAPATGRPAARFVMLDSRLNTEPIALLRLDLGAPGSTSGNTGEIAYLDSAGTRKTRSLSEIIALAPTAWVLANPAAAGGAATAANSAGEEAPSVWIDLIDGQRLTGTFSAPSDGAADSTKPGAPADLKAPKSGADSDAVAWQHPRLGTVNIPLDVTARYVGDAPRLESTLRTPLSRVNDTIVLANGDRVEGFIEHLGTSMRIGPAGSGAAGGTKSTTGGAPAQPSESATVHSIIPSDQVVLAHLVNERRTLSGAAVWLADGSVLALSSARTDADRGRVTLTTRGLNGASASLDLTDLRAAVVDAARIAPLSALPIAAQIGSSDRPSFEPARVDASEEGGAGAPLGAADILLPGPMVVEWVLPGPGEGAAMLGGVAQLDESCWAWGNCVVVFSIVPASDAPLGAESAGASAGRELARGTLNAETPTLNIKADLSTARPGDRLRVRIDAGARGPIQDRVTLRRFIFVSSRPRA